MAVGGSYEMIDGERVLKRRTGWKPEPVSPKGEKKKDGRKSAPTPETTDEGINTHG